MLTLLFTLFMAQAQVVSFDKAPVKAHQKSGAQIKFLVAPQHLKTKSAFMAHLSIPPKGGVPEHRDETEEYLYILKGKGTLWIEDKKYEVKASDTVYMAANAKVRFQNGDEKFEALQIFAPSGPEKKYESEVWK